MGSCLHSFRSRNPAVSLKVDVLVIIQILIKILVSIFDELLTLLRNGVFVVYPKVNLSRLQNESAARQGGERQSHNTQPGQYFVQLSNKSPDSRPFTHLSTNRTSLDEFSPRSILFSYYADDDCVFVSRKKGNISNNNYTIFYYVRQNTSHCDPH